VNLFQIFHFTKSFEIKACKSNSPKEIQKNEGLWCNKYSKVHEVFEGSRSIPRFTKYSKVQGRAVTNASPIK
jgi:hypothetical protein